MLNQEEGLNQQLKLPVMHVDDQSKQAMQMGGWQKPIIVLLLLFLLVQNSSNVVNAQGIILKQNELKIVLSDEVQQALDSGVSLNFVAAAAKNETLFLLSWSKPYSREVFKIQKHALSNQYLVQSLKQNKPRSFSSLRMSLEHIKQLSGVFFRQISEHSAIEGFEPMFRVYLDKFSLPTPMRINAFWSSDWDLDSGWQE